jgi:hypothetical protein
MTVHAVGANLAPVRELSQPRPASPPVPKPLHREGRLQAWRARWLGERDLVADQLADIARQGSGMARLAHVCASLMLVSFSMGSLVALGGDALQNVVTGMRNGWVDVPAIIGLAVSTLFVLCIDVAMLQAASVLRLLGMRRAESSSKLQHRLVMASVTMIEAGTYAYMAWRYETPVGLIAWALILARALAAPLLSVYLAMARPLPVMAKDILAQVELASGLGLIRDAVTIANDPSASLGQKVALFGASAVMTPQDRARLDALLVAVERQQGQRQGAAEELAEGAGVAPDAAAPGREVAPLPRVSSAEVADWSEEAPRPFVAAAR